MTDTNPSSHLTCDGKLLKELATAGKFWLEYNRDIVNQLNVFPVPDGDTGTNMLLTMQKVCEEIDVIDDDHAGQVARAIARGALYGARGNSGVILSQLWGGFARVVEAHETFDAVLFAQACKSAVDTAYKGVITPVEGTILTVARQSMEAVVARAQIEPDLQALLETMVSAAHASLKRTPELLPVLKKAGVVDSGGAGLTYILEGMLRHLRGEPVRLESSIQTGVWQDTLEPEDEEGYGYDVQFLIHGELLDVEAIRAKIDSFGWSTLVVGDEKLIKVHVHVHDPGVPISYAIGLGAAIDDVVVENMQMQYQTQLGKRTVQAAVEEAVTFEPVEGVAVIAVASGMGMQRVFAETQVAHVITGGQTMNPSTEDFVRAIEALPNTEIVLLPNNKNVILAAQQATEIITNKKVRVVPSRSVPQGITAMFAYGAARESGDLDMIVDAMRDALNTVATGEITTAVRDAEFDGVKVSQGQVIGLLEGKLVTSGDSIPKVAHDLLEAAHAEERELITLYYGDNQNEAAAQSLADTLAKTYSDQEILIVYGGQVLYPYLISVE